MPTRIVLLAISFLTVLVFDHVLKFAVVQWLQRDSISLGIFGRIAPVRKSVWIQRCFGKRLILLWSLWGLGALTLVCSTLVVPIPAPFSVLLLAGSFSHALETTMHGSICDYICLRFWPAFNFADVAIVIGTFGFVAQIAVLLLK